MARHPRLRAAGACRSVLTFKENLQSGLIKAISCHPERSNMVAKSKDLVLISLVTPASVPGPAYTILKTFENFGPRSLKKRVNTVEGK